MENFGAVFQLARIFHRLVENSVDVHVRGFVFQIYYLQLFPVVSWFHDEPVFACVNFLAWRTNFMSTINWWLCLLLHLLIFQNRLNIRTLDMVNSPIATMQIQGNCLYLLLKLLCLTLLDLKSKTILGTRFNWASNLWKLQDLIPIFVFRWLLDLAKFYFRKHLVDHIEI